MSNVAIALLIFGGIVVIGVLIAAILNIAELFDLYHTLAQVVDDLDKDMDRRCAEIGTLRNELKCLKSDRAATPLQKNL